MKQRSLGKRELTKNTRTLKYGKNGKNNVIPSVIHSNLNLKRKSLM